MGLQFGYFKAKYFKPSFVSGQFRFVICCIVNFILFKVPMLCMQVCSCLPNHLSVRQGGSLVFEGPLYSTNRVFLMQISFMLCITSLVLILVD